MRSVWGDGNANYSDLIIIYITDIYQIITQDFIYIYIYIITISPLNINNKTDSIIETLERSHDLEVGIWRNDSVLAVHEDLSSDTATLVHLQPSARKEDHWTLLATSLAPCSLRDPVSKEYSEE